MVKLVEPTEEEIKSIEDRSHGRITDYIFKQFEESGLRVAKVEIEPNRNPMTLLQLLRMTIKNKHLPYVISTRRGTIFISKAKPREVVKLTEEMVDEQH